MLEIEQLSVGYADKTIIHNASFSVPEGKVTVLFGPNGCGKSTLLKTLCGILPTNSGKVLLCGENLLALQPKDLAQRIAYLAQNRQIPDITVSRLVLHGRFPYLSYPRNYRPQDYAAAEAAMEQMGITELADTPLEQLSGGQRQKVYIAMALAQDTPIVLLDEPTTYLDIKHQLGMMRQAKELAESGKTVLMVVHDIDQAMNVADKLVLLQDGRVVVQGTPEEVYKSRQLPSVFDVEIHRIKTDRGWRYFCEEEYE